MNNIHIQAQIVRSVICTLSIVGSTIIDVMIVRSKNRSPYSRIIFGLSFCDILHSIGLLLSPLLAPMGTKNAAWALGNVESCEFIGFILNIGICGVPFYTAFLALYFDQRVRKKVTPKEFASGVEIGIHIVLWFYPVAGGIYGLFQNYFNPVGKGNMCTFADQPFNCSNKNSLVECERAGRSARKLRIVYQSFIPYTVALLIMVVSFTRLTLHVYRQEKMFQPSKEVKKKKDNKVIHGIHAKNANDKSNDVHGTVAIGNEAKKNVSSLETKQISTKPMNSTTNPSEKRIYSNEEGRLVTLQQKNSTIEVNNHRPRQQRSPLAKKALVQSLLYISVYFLTYGVPMVISYTSIAGVKLQNNNILIVWRSIVWPLGGIFNVFIYTRPKIETLRKRDEYKNSSWFKLFWKVIRGGGEMIPSAKKQAKLPIVNIKKSEKPHKLGLEEEKQYDELDHHESMERDFIAVSGKELQEDSVNNRQGNREYYNSSQFAVESDNYEDFDILGEISHESREFGDDSNCNFGLSSFEEFTSDLNSSHL